MALNAFVVQGQVPVYTEGFETWPPAGWTSYTLGAGSGWIQNWQGPQVAHSGSYSAYPCISSGGSDNWLVSPVIDVAQPGYELVFWELFGDIQYYDLSEVLISTGSADPSDGDFVSVYETSDTATSWTQAVIDLNAYAGQNLYVAFHYVSTFHLWYVDDVAIGPAGFTDIRPVAFLAPVPVSNLPGSAGVELEVTNSGVQAVDSIWVDWSVNGIPQSTVGYGGLNLMANTSAQLVLGNHPFPAYGAYILEAVTHAQGDIDPSNDTLAFQYSVAPYQHVSLDRLRPEGYAGSPGTREMSLTLANKGDSVVQDVVVNWSVDGVVQTPAQITGAGIPAGTSAELAFGTFNFPGRGVYVVEADIEVLGDTSSQDNLLRAYVAVDTLWESFEGQTFPPENWTSEFGLQDDINFDIPPHGIRYYVAFSDNNFFGQVTDTLYTPLLDIATGNDVFSFRIKKSAFYPATVSVVWKNGQTGVVSTIQTVTPPTDVWAPVSVNISAAAGVNRIGIVTSSTGPGEVKLDLITSTARPFVFPHDLVLVEPRIWPIARVGGNSLFPARVRNNGQFAVLGADYSVGLYRADGTLLDSLPGIDLPPQGQHVFEIPVNFSATELMKAYLRIHYPADDNPANDRSEEWLLHVLPADVVEDAVGTKGPSNANIPFDGGGDTWTFSKDDLSQSVILASDLDGAGVVYGMYLSFRNILTSGGDYPLRVWLDQPVVADVDNDWQDMSQAQLVFDDTVRIRPIPEEQVLYIPFSQPMLLTGANDLVYQFNQFSGPWPPTIPRFAAFSTDPNGPNRSRSVLNSLLADPANPPSFSNGFKSVPFTVLVGSPSTGFGVVEGFVTDVNNVPIEGAIVSVSGTPLRDTTDASGLYSIGNVPYADITLNAVAFGYNDTTEMVSVSAPVTFEDLIMTERPLLSISGVVTGNDAPAVPLQHVTVSYTGYTNGDVPSNANGQFVLSGLPGQATYEVRFSMRGYRDSVRTVDLDVLSLDLDTIVLVQELLAAHDVRVVDLGSSAEITWADPRLSREVLWTVDAGTCSFSYTNEPLEDVYLGNLFTITDTLTLSHVEVRFDVFPNAFDTVTIAVLDANEEVLVVSEPFITPMDSTFTVDIPNIMVDDDVYVMLHWKNNAASTNALCIDLTPGLDDRAYIKYPGVPAELLSVFLGADPGAFNLRLGMLENDMPVTSAPAPVYNLYRGHADSVAYLSNWVPLNTMPVIGLQEQDSDWSILPVAPYRYAVEAVHATGSGEWTISLPIHPFDVGVEEEALFRNVSVYPNPATTQLDLRFELSTSARLEVTLFDPLGRVVKPVQRSEGTMVSMVLDVADLATGNYQLQVRVNDALFQRQVMILGDR